MTVSKLSTALELAQEMGSGALIFVYQRRSAGIPLFAVFPDAQHVDLGSAPEVEMFALVDPGQWSGGWP